MRKPEQAPEPSIEEILASIRRIIADDAVPAASAAHEDGQARVHAYSGGARLRPPGSPMPAGESSRGEDDVFELTEDFMLAEEAPAMALQELQEPAEQHRNGSHDDPFAEKTIDDPYDETAYGRKFDSAPPAANAAVDKQAADAQRNGLASVMAEVRRFVDIGKAPEAPEAAAKSSDERGQSEAEPPKPEPTPRPSSRWSARHKAGEASKAAETEVTARSGRFEPPVWRDKAAPRKPGRENWSLGVQTPMPEEAPAIPFGAEQSLDLPPAPPPLPPAPADWMQSAPPRQAEPVAPADEREPAPHAGNARAEKLAQQAMTDFASDRLSSTPVADYLKADRPLMEEITGTLANALARVGDFDDTAPPLEDIDLAQERAAAELPVHVRQSEPLPLELPAMPERFARPELPKLNAGFMAAAPVSLARPQPNPAAYSDQDAPELPREESDEVMSVPHPEQQAENAAAFQPTGIVEFPAMPQVPAAAPGWIMPRPAPGIGGPREPELGRFQPSSAAAKSLEETVREMLRPLLAQWLNENMPRILNDALRDEVAAAGLLPPRPDNERR